MPRFVLHISLIVFLLQGASIYAQSDTTTSLINKEVRLIKHDGTEYVGTLLSDDGREVLINSKSVGKIYIPKHELKVIRSLETESETEKSTEKDEQKEEDIPDTSSVNVEQPKVFKYDNYISTKYIQTDNALPLRKGESFIKFSPFTYEGQLRLTDNWSAGVMGSYIGAPIIVKTKYSFPFSEKACLSLDAAYGTFAFATWTTNGIRDGAGLLTSTFTAGDRLKNFSIKVGYGFAHNLIIDQWGWNNPGVDSEIISSHMEYIQFGMAAVGGMVKLNEKNTFVFDGGIVLLDGGEIGAMAGAASRFGPSPRHQFQLGGSFLFFSTFPVPLPLFNVSYTFVFLERNP
ncbi:MAG: hypothetical protein WDZ35_05655 [Crocinitomicaceae bacterium]